LIPGRGDKPRFGARKHLAGSFRTTANDIRILIGKWKAAPGHKLCIAHLREMGAAADTDIRYLIPVNGDRFLSFRLAAAGPRRRDPMATPTADKQARLLTATGPGRLRHVTGSSARSRESCDGRRNALRLGMAPPLFRALFRQTRRNAFAIPTEFPWAAINSPATVRRQRDHGLGTGRRFKPNFLIFPNDPRL